MIPFLDVGLCTLLAVEGRIRVDDIGWREDLRLTVAGAPGCDAVRFDLPDGITLDAVKGRLDPVRGKKVRLGPEHLVREHIDEHGVATWALVAGQIRTDELLTVDLVRRWHDPIDLVIPAGHDGADVTLVKLPKGITTVHHHMSIDKRTAVAIDPDPDAYVRLIHPWADDAALPPAIEADPTTWTWVPRAAFGRAPVVGADAAALGAADDRGLARAMASQGDDVPRIGRWSPSAISPVWPGAPEVAVVHSDAWPHPDQPLGDGIVHLPDGHGARVAAQVPAPVAAPTWTSRAVVTLEGRDVRDALADATWRELLAATWADDTLDRARWTALPLPRDTVAVDVEASTCDHLRVGDDAVWLVAAPGRAHCAVVLVRALHDAWGAPHPLATLERAAGTWTLLDREPTDLDIRHTPDSWWIARVGVTRLLDDTDRRDRAIADRVVLAAYPEPSIPVRYKADHRGWDYVAALREVLAERLVVVPDLALDPAWPRHLVTARRGRAVLPSEAAIISALIAQQAKLDARWALVRPVDAVYAGLSFAGFDDAIVEIRHDGETRWTDPACPTCAPFEVRPWLVGAQTAGPGQTPEAPTAEQLEALHAVALTAGVALTRDTWDPGVGALLVARRDDGLTLTFEGAAATAFRAWAARQPAGTRDAALRAWLGVGRLADQTAEGLRAPGEPVRLSLTGDDDLLAWDPITARSDGRDPLAFWGPRVVVDTTTTEPAPPTMCVRPTHRYDRTASAEGSVEVLTPWAGPGDRVVDARCAIASP